MFMITVAVVNANVGAHFNEGAVANPRVKYAPNIRDLICDCVPEPPTKNEKHSSHKEGVSLSMLIKPHQSSQLVHNTTDSTTKSTAATLVIFTRIPSAERPLFLVQ